MIAYEAERKRAVNALIRISKDTSHSLAPAEGMLFIAERNRPIFAKFKH